MHINRINIFLSMALLTLCQLFTSCEWNYSNVYPLKTNRDNHTQNSTSTAQTYISPSIIEQSSNERDSKNDASSSNAQSSSRAGVFDLKNPSIIGLKLGDSYEKVLALWGKSKTIFPIDDPDGPFTIYTYSSFSIGINTDKKVMFISVDSKEIDPGLGGVRVQQSIEDLIRLLGSPQSKTEVVVNYMSDTTILKIDIDAQTNQILSIKLFSR